MHNYLIYISYDGTSYSGYQIQKNADTVGIRIKNALIFVFGEVSELHGCSRTDSGVHANEYAVSFKSEKKLSENSVVNALNSKLPDDISVLRCEYCSDSFHARYSVVKKEYVYYIYNGENKNPFYRNYSLFRRGDIDVEKMNRCAQLFLGTHNFSSFKASGGNSEDTVRTIYSVSVERKGNFVILKICGNGFLYKMVRIIMGTLLCVSDGKLSEADIINSLNSENLPIVFTVPPQGLFLNRVYYED